MRRARPRSASWSTTPTSPTPCAASATRRWARSRPRAGARASSACETRTDTSCGSATRYAGSLLREGSRRAPIGADAQVGEPERIEEARAGARPLQQRDLRGGSRDGAAIGDHARAARPALDRPAGSRVEDVRVAHAVDDHAALVVAAGRERGAEQADARDRALGLLGVADADDPGLAVGVRADRVQVAAQVDHAAADAARATQIGDEVD